MNVAFTRAAEGLPRRAFAVDDISRMMEAGIVGEDENFELIEGDPVVMAARHVGHDRIKRAQYGVGEVSARGRIRRGRKLASARRDVLVEPDITVISQAVYAANPKSFARPRPEDVHLLIEVAVSSLAYDRGIKARLYARHGIREFWVIDAEARTTWMYTGPSRETWSSIVERKAQDALTTPALPDFSIRLADIA